MSKRLLLTGVGGSIGVHALIHFLHNTDWHVVGIDSFRHKGLTDRVAKMLAYHPEHAHRVTVLAHDLTAPVSRMLRRQIGGIDHVVNIASLSDVHDSIVNPAQFMEANVKIATTVLELARESPPEVFLQVSTDEVYGPTDGTSDWPEWSPIVPSNPYSASKVAQEAACIAWWRTYGVPVVIVNLMNNFGEMQSPAKFPAIVQRKVRAGEEVEIHADERGLIGSRCYIHSRNSADAMIHILRTVKPRQHQDGDLDRPDRFNIPGDRRVGNLELAMMIADMIGKPLRYRMSPASASRPGHDVHYGLDGSKLLATGWKSPVPFEVSMRRVVEWYEENPEWLEAR